MAAALKRLVGSKTPLLNRYAGSSSSSFMRSMSSSPRLKKDKVSAALGSQKPPNPAEEVSRTFPREQTQEDQDILKVMAERNTENMEGYLRAHEAVLKSKINEKVAYFLKIKRNEIHSKAILIEELENGVASDKLVFLQHVVGGVVAVGGIAAAIAGWYSSKVAPQ